MKARIYITLKQGILDPQGKAVQHSLHTMGYPSIKDVRVGKLIEIIMDDKSPAEAEQEIKEICSRLLANPVIEDYRYEIIK